MVNHSRLVAPPLHSIFPSVQLSAQRSGETVACLVSLGRGLLGRVNVVWFIWRIPLIPGSHVLPQVRTLSLGGVLWGRQNIDLTLLQERRARVFSHRWHDGCSCYSHRGLGWHRSFLPYANHRLRTFARLGTSDILANLWSSTLSKVLLTCMTVPTSKGDES